jgi:hypothetical protein
MDISALMPPLPFTRGDEAPEAPEALRRSDDPTPPLKWKS